MTVLATIPFDQQRIDLQFGPNVEWSEWVQPTRSVHASVAPAIATNTPSDDVRDMYARLAQAYATEPAVPDRGGGVPGDPFPL